jgi:hypothetical protein
VSYGRDHEICDPPPHHWICDRGHDRGHDHGHDRNHAICDYSPSHFCAIFYRGHYHDRDHVICDHALSHFYVAFYRGHDHEHAPSHVCVICDRVTFVQVHFIQVF